jgi:DNA-binding NarL/FixJ family response regulator
MDDEPLVLKVGLKHLRKLGFEVDVAILDLTVPGGMGGAEALEQIREIDPGAVAIACSGYFEDGIMADPGKFGFAGVLGKPYLTADMQRVLAEVASRERYGCGSQLPAGAVVADCKEDRGRDGQVPGIRPPPLARRLLYLEA